MSEIFSAQSERDVAVEQGAKAHRYKGTKIQELCAFVPLALCAYAVGNVRDEFLIVERI